MNRDNLLFLVIGLLFGFIAGYVLHEEMAARQPPRAPAGAGEAVAGAGSPFAPPPGSGPDAGAGPSAASMEEVQRLRAYVEENPEDSNAVRTLANLNYDIENWQRAAELYEQYLKLAPGEVDVLTDLGASYRHMGQAEKALAIFQQVKQADPKHWQARYNEILVLAFDLRRVDAAQTAMRELQALEPSNPQVSRLAEEILKAGPG